MSKLIEPGTVRWGRLDVFQKFDAAQDLLAEERQKSRPNVDRVTDLEALSMRYRAEAATIDPIWDMEHNLWLSTKGSDDTLLSPWPAQTKVIKHIFERLAKITKVCPFGTPVRLYIPKSRQHGITQIIAAVFYILSRLTNRNTLVMAHETGPAHEIFSKYLRFHEGDPFAPTTKRANTDELIFGDIHSQILVESAGVTQTGKGHSYRFNHFHASEVARWKTPNIPNVVSGILNTMPSPNDGWTCAVFESTGNGPQGWFYEKVCQLLRIENGEEPDSEMSFASLMFLPAYERFGSEIAFENGWARNRFEAGLNEEEKLLLANYPISLEFLNWRRYVYENDIEGFDTSEKRRNLKEAQPMHVMECFQSSGGSVFDQDKIDTLIKSAKPPKEFINLESSLPMWAGSGYTFTTPTPVPKVTGPDEQQGPLAVWERPAPGHFYTMGVDVAEGVVKGDFQVIVVYDRTARRDVARYRSKIPLPLLQAPLRLISKWYNDATINIEVNFQPTVVEQLAQSDRRPFLALRRNPTGTDATDATQMQWGWKTSAHSKRQMVAKSKQVLEFEPESIVDVMLLHEMRTFQEEVNSQGLTVYPNKGNRDDVWVAHVLARMADEDVYMQAKPAEPEPEVDPTSPKGVWDAAIERQSDEAGALTNWLEEPW